MNDLILAVNGYRPSKDYLRVLYTSGACVFAGGDPCGRSVRR